MSTINRADNSATPYRNDEIGDIEKSANVKQQTTMNDQDHSSHSTNSDVLSYRANGKEISERKAEIAAKGMSRQFALQRQLQVNANASSTNAKPGQKQLAGAGQTQASGAIGSAQTGLPARTITVTLYDSNGKLITSRTEPLYDDANADMFFGEVKGNGIDWNEDGVQVKVDARLGTKIDKEGHPSGGISVENWTQKAGHGRARYVLVEIENSTVQQKSNPTGTPISDKSGSPGSKRSTGSSSNSEKTSTKQGAGSGVKGTTTGVPGGAQRDGGTAGKPIKNGVPAEENRPGNTNKPGHEGVGGTDHVKVQGPQKKGTPDGKKDGNKTDGGYFYDPKTAHGKGQEDVAPKGAVAGGMAGGSGSEKDHGVPTSGGIGGISVPKEIRGAVAVGMILIDADIKNLGDEIFQISKKLGKQAAGKGGALAATIANKLDRYADREVEKAITLLREEKRLPKMTADQEKTFVKEMREELKELAKAKLEAELDKIIDAKNLGQLKKDAEAGNEYAKDLLADSEAAQRAKDVLPEKPARPKNEIAKEQKQTHPAKGQESPRVEWEKVPRELRTEVSNLLNEVDAAAKASRNGNNTALESLNRNRRGHALTANDEGWISYDITGPQNPNRILIKLEKDGRIKLPVEWRLKDTHI